MFTVLRNEGHGKRLSNVGQGKFSSCFDIETILLNTFAKIFNFLNHGPLVTTSF